MLSDVEGQGEETLKLADFSNKRVRVWVLPVRLAGSCGCCRKVAEIGQYHSTGVRGPCPQVARAPRILPHSLEAAQCAKVPAA